MLKRLFDSVVHGFGFSAGKALFEDAVEKAAAEFREPTEEEKQKAAKEAEKRAIAEEKQRLADAKKAEKERKKVEAEIDDELDALKKALKKKERG